MTIAGDSKGVRLNSRRKVYELEFLPEMAWASRSAYRWCFAPIPGSVASPATVGVYFGYIGVVGSLALCATLPATPVLLGLLGTPVEAVIALFNPSLHVDEVASRRFARLTRGEDMTVNPAVLDEMLLQLSEF